jgi:hypothetical protein
MGSLCSISPYRKSGEHSITMGKPARLTQTIILTAGFQMVTYPGYGYLNPGNDFQNLRYHWGCEF